MTAKKKGKSKKTKTARKTGGRKGSKTKMNTKSARLTSPGKFFVIKNLKSTLTHCSKLIIISSRLLSILSHFIAF